MKRISCIIFDLDGTLTQTNELIFATFNHVIQKYLGKTFTPAEIVATFGPPEEIAIERLVGKQNIENAMDDFYSFYEDNHALAVAHEGVHEILSKLKQKGVVIALFTGKGRRTTLITLEKFDMKQYFDLIVTGSDVVNHKPSADGIRNVLRMFKLMPEQTLMVGDAVSDVKAAHEAGVGMAAVLWDSYAKDHVLQMDADYFFHDIPEFAEWLQINVPLNGARVH